MAVQDRQSPSLRLPTHRPPNGNGDAGQACSWAAESCLRTHRPLSGRGSAGQARPSSWPPVVPEGRPQRAHGHAQACRTATSSARQEVLASLRTAHRAGTAVRGRQGPSSWPPVVPEGRPQKPHANCASSQDGGQLGRGPWLPAHRPPNGNGSAGQPRPLPSPPHAPPTERERQYGEGCRLGRRTLPRHAPRAERGPHHGACKASPGRAAQSTRAAMSLARSLAGS